jgi:hypothetical protein
VMNEHILAGFLCNEPKTLLVVEPLDFAAGHNSFLVAETQIKKDTRWFPPAGVPSQFTEKRMRLEITTALKRPPMLPSRISFTQQRPGISARPIRRLPKQAFYKCRCRHSPAGGNRRLM